MTPPTRIRSRVSETIRQLYLLHNRFDFSQAISTLEYENKWKAIPKWEEPIGKVITELSEEIKNGFEIEELGIKTRYEYARASKTT